MHWVGNTKNYNGFIRQVRACLLNAPRVKRSTTTDLNTTGHSYKNGSNVDRAQSDVGFAIAETGALRGIYRATCVTAGGAATWGAGQSVSVNFHAASRTLTLVDASSWVTKGFAVGDLIRIENAVTAGHNNVGRILSFSNSGGTNDVLTLRTEDTFITVNDTSDTVTVYPINSGAIFEVKYDTNGDGTPETHVGWLASNVEAYTKNFSLWMELDRGNADWVVNDYWQFELEHGPFTMNEDRVVTIENAVISGTNVITLSAIDQVNGITWTNLGFIDEHRIDILVSTGANTGRYRISALTATAITLQTLAGGAPGLTNGTVTIQAVPKLEVDVDFDPADATFSNAPTIVLNGGGNWVSLNFHAGGFIQVEDATDSGNRGYWKIASIGTETVTNDTLVLAAGSLATLNAIDLISATPRNTSLQAWTEHRFRLATSGTSPDSTNDAISSSGVANGRLIRPDTEGNYVTEWIGIGPGIDPENNAQTVYIGMQSQFSGDSRQNIEHRNFDVVSDTSFGLMLGSGSNIKVYSFATLSVVMQTVLEFDGDHLVGFNDDGAMSSWFYQGYIAVRGTQNQYPRPMFLGGTGYKQTDDRSVANGGTAGFFFDGQSQSSTNSFEVTPPSSTGWLRWIDGQWLPVYHSQIGQNNSSLSIATAKLQVWPWRAGLSATSIANNSFFGGINNFTTLANMFGRTPATFDPTDRHYLLTPATIWMEDPDENIIGDFKGVYYIPGVGGLGSKDRQVIGHRVFYVAQNHKATNNDDFVAVELT